MTDQIDAIPIVIEERWGVDEAAFISPAHPFNESGVLELQCNKATGDKLMTEEFKTELTRILSERVNEYLRYGRRR